MISSGEVGAPPNSEDLSEATMTGERDYMGALLGAGSTMGEPCYTAIRRRPER